jgi:cysteinyl-tRNA synthetase
MPDSDIPDHIRALADARALARASRDWAEADRLRSEIDAAGWTIVDAGFSYRIEPGTPPTQEVGDDILYGRSIDVPSRLAEPATAPASVILVATDWPDDLARAVAALHRHARGDIQVVVVADGPSVEQEDALADLPAAEIIRTSGRLGLGVALNIGLRRAIGRVVIVMDTSIEPVGDVVTPLVQALDDPTVAVAGPFGIVSSDLRHFSDAPPGDVDAIEGYLQAFRRGDAADRGALDERFRFYRNLDIWWSLVLRDEGEGRPPRRGLAVDGLPLARHEHRGWVSLPADEVERLSKRNFYRIIDRFGSRRDLLVDAAAAPLR